jgi:FtsP/CotA-like multicopper oxidase with cupredoxin domain
MYGTFIIDPRNDPRPVPAQDFIMEENSFDLTDPLGDAALKNADGTNSIFAMNAIPFWYKQHPIDVEAGKLYRIYLVNFQSFDPLSTFHLQGANFTYTPTGTIGSAQTVTNTISFGEGQRGVIDVTFPKPGDYQFTNAAFGAAAKGFIGTFHVTE